MEENFQTVTLYEFTVTLIKMYNLLSNDHVTQQEAY